MSEPNGHAAYICGANRHQQCAPDWDEPSAQHRL